MVAEGKPRLLLAAILIYALEGLAWLGIGFLVIFRGIVVTREQGVDSTFAVAIGALAALVGIASFVLCFFLYKGTKRAKLAATAIAVISLVIEFRFGSSETGSWCFPIRLAIALFQLYVLWAEPKTKAYLA